MTYRKNEDEKKVQLNLKVKKKTADEVRTIKNYSPKIERLIEDNMENLKKDG